MDRRDMLTGLASAIAITTTRPLLAIPSPTPDSRFRWSSAGRVLVREAHRWVESINLGKQIRILSVEDSGAHATLTAEHAGRRFQLQTSDGRGWRA